jgi:hypothetical protein
MEMKQDSESGGMQGPRHDLGTYFNRWRRKRGCTPSATINYHRYLVCSLPILFDDPTDPSFAYDQEGEAIALLSKPQRS